MREETDEGEELDDIAGGFQLAAIHVDGITERLESIETDANRQDHLQQQSVRLSTEESIRKGSDKEIVIFENAQNQQVKDDIDDVDRLRFPWFFLVLINEKSCPETTRGSECNQKQEPPIPPPVEDVGHHHDKKVLQFQVLLEDEPIEQKHYRQEDGEFYGIKKHLRNDD